MSAPWSEQQREWLQALGHDVLMFAPGSIAATSAPSSPSADDVISAGRVAGITSSDSPLLRALARAAGRQPQDSEFQLVLPDLSTLCGDPAARRALWPRLRALRKASRG